ncbi:hypothetical protein NA78x_002282 [Anatilimnocola sp. NA78]|uniref:hypothetical protein n=1 Tax=Anatilimnocola sp. NA78 TaxID=3415683 RepID=UPI003CE55C54
MLSAVAFGLLFAGCEQKPVARPVPGADQALKLRVTSTGEVFAEAVPVTLPQLEERIATHQATGKPIWYYREMPEEEPHPNAMKVITLMAKSGLPVKLSAEPDYSDSVDDNGRSRKLKY